MASVRIPDAVKRVFTETFTARDVAEPLASFDALCVHHAGLSKAAPTWAVVMARRAEQQKYEWPTLVTAAPLSCR